jgi:hypothetical protein
VLIRFARRPHRKRVTVGGGDQEDERSVTHFDPPEFPSAPR